MYNSYERKEKFEQLGVCDHLGVLVHIHNPTSGGAEAGGQESEVNSSYVAGSYLKNKLPTNKYADKQTNQPNKNKK